MVDRHPRPPPAPSRVVVATHSAIWLGNALWLGVLRSPEHWNRQKSSASHAVFAYLISEANTLSRLE
ncbi:hypothetical protein SynNOUM97013_02915 [Synechococcus sp. NOUM97013]|nr:hypothetical protein SynNOUM97013_02915 [Synechococcus sp. NOUM97013]